MRRELRRCLAAFPDLLVYPNVSEGAVLAFPDLLVYPNDSEGADSVSGQLRENKSASSVA